MHYVYVLFSKKYNQKYIGSTNHLYGRLKKHNLGLVVSTKRYRPWKLVYYEAYEEENLARRREQSLKNHGKAKRELFKKAGLINADVI